MIIKAYEAKGSEKYFAVSEEGGSEVENYVFDFVNLANLWGVYSEWFLKDIEKSFNSDEVIISGGTESHEYKLFRQNLLVRDELFHERCFSVSVKEMLDFMIIFEDVKINGGKRSMSFNTLCVGNWPEY